MMEQYKNYADQRYGQACVYCHGSIETREHTPSRVFLDEPYPENLPIVGACRECNNGFSLDEEYMACLIECVICGTTDVNKLRRNNIKKTLLNSPSLHSKLSNVQTEKDGFPFFHIESDRIRKVVRKIACGHIFYELNQEVNIFDDSACQDFIHPICTFSEDARVEFENTGIDTLGLWPEVGSRAMQRMLIADDQVFHNGWLVVQEGRYRYVVIQDIEFIEVRMVFSEYLACIVRCSE